MMNRDGERRCACVQLERASEPGLEQYEDCPPTAIECHLKQKPKPLPQRRALARLKQVQQQVQQQLPHVPGHPRPRPLLSLKRRLHAVICRRSR